MSTTYVNPHNVTMTAADIEEAKTTLTAKEKAAVASLVSLGDNEALAVKTVVVTREHTAMKESAVEAYRNAYCN